MFDLILKFTSLIDLQDFLKSYNKLQNKKMKTQTVNDENTQPSARGEAVRQLHIKAKQYKIDHPEIDYKQCLKMINK
jgi:hypothetical protein